MSRYYPIGTKKNVNKNDRKLHEEICTKFLQNKVMEEPKKAVTKIANLADDCCEYANIFLTFTHLRRFKLWLPKCVNIRCGVYAFDNFHILTIKFKYI